MRMETANRKFIFNLKISQEEYASYYRGEKNMVLATATNGRRIRFPAAILRRFLTHNGIRGTFEMVIDQNNRFLNLRKID